MKMFSINSAFNFFRIDYNLWFQKLGETDIINQIHMLCSFHETLICARYRIMDIIFSNNYI